MLHTRLGLVQITVPTADSPAGLQPDGDDTAVVRTYLEHDNHDPYSLEDAKYLPTHPTALAFAEEELVRQTRREFRFFWW